MYWKIWKPAGIKSFISESRRHAGNVFDEFTDKRVRYDLVGNYWLVKFNFMRLLQHRRISLVGTFELFSILTSGH